MMPPPNTPYEPSNLSTHIRTERNKFKTLLDDLEGEEYEATRETTRDLSKVLRALETVKGGTPLAKSFS